MKGRVGLGLLAWLGGLAVVGVAAHPESCPAATPEQATAAAQAAVTWIAVNQEPDGAFLYRYDRDAGEVLEGYNTVRHAGTLVALEQAAALGLDDAEEAAEFFADGENARRLGRSDSGQTLELRTIGGVQTNLQ